MPMTTTSTRSAISVYGRECPVSSRGPRLRERLIQGQPLALRPGLGGLDLTHSLGSGAALLLTQELPEAGSGRPLVGFRRAGQPRRSPGVPLRTNHLREVVELKHQAGNVPRLLKQFECFEEVLAGLINVACLERDQAVSMDRPGEAKAIVDRAKERLRLFQHGFGRGVIALEVEAVAERP